MILETLPAAVPALAVLAQGAVAVRDTLVTISATPTGWKFWVDTLTSIASVVIALVLIVGALAAIPLGLNALRALRTVNRLAAQVRGEVAPLIQHGHTAAENLAHISGSVRAEVDRLSHTIASADARVNRAAALAEERINDFNALLRVVQEEAEGLFIDTASTLHGARVSAEALQSHRKPPPAEPEDDSFGA